MKNPPAKIPFAYFLTFRTYGTWLHGDEKQSVDRKHNIPGTPRIEVNSSLESAMKESQNEEAFILDNGQSHTVLQSVIETCQYNHWTLYAAHVRTNHLHIVLTAENTAEHAMGKLKCYGTKNLKKNHPELSERKHFWARHGSTKNVWTYELLFPCLYYVVKEQGKPIALYYDKEIYESFDEEMYKSYR